MEGFLFSHEIARYRELFDGNRSQYAVGRLKDVERGKYSYFKVEEPFTDEVVLAHIHQGTKVIGVYCLNEQGQCRWACFDFDAPDEVEGVDEQFNAAMADALAQMGAFQDAGIECHLERSRSGSGVHLWVFVDEWMDPRVVRRALLPLLVKNVDTMDRGKIYPSNPDSSANGILICLPYNAWAVAKGYNTFLDEDLRPQGFDDFIANVRVNFSSVIRRIAEKHPERVSAPKKVVMRQLEDGTVVEEEVTYGEGNGGRPDPLYDTGVLKLFGPKGCAFLHHTVNDQHRTDSKRKVREAEWYAALGQLTAFKHGATWAHLLWRHYQWYEPAGMTAKFAHATQSPPVGCDYIHENFPQYACEHCPRNGKGQRLAPYYLSQNTCKDLAKQSVGEMEHGNYDEDRERIRRRDAGEDAGGFYTGIDGLDQHFKWRNSELTFIGAQPSIGKTALMVDVACAVAHQEIWTYVFSAETDRAPLHDRLIAHEAYVDSRALRGERHGQPISDDEWTRIEKAIQTLKGLRLYENYSALFADDMIALIERNMVQEEQPYEDNMLVLFDYAQYGAMADATERETESNIIAKRALSFKFMQKVLGKPVGVFSQLVRDAEGDDKPKITSFAGSRVIEQITDNGFVLTGERVVGPEAPRLLHIVKQKEGTVGVEIPFVLHQAVCRFVTRRTQPAPVQTPDHGPLLSGADNYGDWSK